MTQAEFDALPTANTFGSREEIRDGKRVRIPVMENLVGALWEEPGTDDGVYVDQRGVRWRVGWANGVRYKTWMGWGL